jgi:hypothetical protein
MGPARLSISEVYADLYVLGPGDGLQLTFLDPAAKDVGGSFGILPDGTSSLPLLGSVQLTGLTISQASRWLTSLYGKQLKRPQLYLTLITPRPVKVSIIGEVEKPGLYPLAPFSTPVSAIQQVAPVDGIQGRMTGTTEKEAGVRQLAVGGCGDTGALGFRDGSPGGEAKRSFGDLLLLPNLGLPAIVEIQCHQGQPDGLAQQGPSQGGVGGRAAGMEGHGSGERDEERRRKRSG